MLKTVLNNQFGSIITVIIILLNTHSKTRMCYCIFISESDITGTRYEVLLFLESKNRICIQITYVQSFALFLQSGVFPTQEPSDVREEEAACRIVGISVGFTVLVMHPVISRPIDDRILQNNRLYYLSIRHDYFLQRSNNLLGKRAC